MSFEQNLESITLIAAADLSTHQFKFVTVDSAGKAALAGSGVKAEGVLQNKPASGEAGTVAVAGTSKVVAGAVVAAGANIMSNASGKGITATSTNFILGTALEAASGDGAIIAVRLDIAGKL